MGNKETEEVKYENSKENKLKTIKNSRGGGGNRQIKIGLVKADYWGFIEKFTTTNQHQPHQPSSEELVLGSAAAPVEREREGWAARMERRVSSPPATAGTRGSPL